MPRWGIAAGIAAAIICAYAVFKVTRGIRNKNPGNLKDAGINWQGQIGKDADDFVEFDSAHNGLRAAGITALAYWQDHNISTLRQFGERWDADSNRFTYGLHLANRIGVGADDAFDFVQDLPALLRAVVIEENGFSFYSEADYIAASNAALSHKGIV